MRTYEPMIGSDIRDAINELVILANEHREAVGMEFNDQPVIAQPGSSANALYDEWQREMKRRHDEYERSPEGIAAKAARDEANRKAEEFQKSGIREFTVKDESAWREWVDKNKDGYGSACVRYAAYWAHLMEREIKNGASVASIAERTSHDADVEGITGFMYGCAVSMLAQCWGHGEELRRWHNVDTQIGDEGEKANESGGVLNPALLNIGRKE